MQRLLALGAFLVLTGCGLPPAVTIVSYALDGLSYLSTGKSVSDHALSVVAEQDCAVWRVIKGELVCKDYEDGETGILVAFAEKWKESAENGIIDPEGQRVPEPAIASTEGQDSGGQVALNDPVVLPHGMADLLPGLRGVASVAASYPTGATGFAGAPASAEAGLRGFSGVDDDLVLDVPRSSRWRPVLAIDIRKAPHATARPPQRSADGALLVMGSFSSRRNAERAARGWRDLDPVVVAARIGGRAWYRVVSGPFASDDIGARKQALASRGLRDVWTVRRCAAGARRDDCVRLPDGA